MRPTRPTALPPYLRRKQSQTARTSASEQDRETAPGWPDPLLRQTTEATTPLSRLRGPPQQYGKLCALAEQALQWATAHRGGAKRKQQQTRKTQRAAPHRTQRQRQAAT